MTIDKATRALEIRRQLDAFRRQPGRYKDMQALLSRFAIERFLYRLGESKHCDKFVLVGESAVAIHIPETVRFPLECDLLAGGRYSPMQLVNMLREVCAIKKDDGISFRSGKIAVQTRGSAFAVLIPASLAESQCSVHLNIGFGETKSTLIKISSVLELPRPKLKLASMECVVAEMILNIVVSGLSNTRLRDYATLHLIGESGKLSKEALEQEVSGLFERRKTELPAEVPVGLSEAFFTSKSKLKEWDAVIKRCGLEKGLGLEEVCVGIWEWMSD